MVYLSGQTFFNHVNTLGSTTMWTNQSGAEAEDMLFYPWGDVWQTHGSGGYNFAYLPYLRYSHHHRARRRLASTSPNFGRWFSPDPDNAAAQPSDPQTWNTYAYVRNNPTTLTDPTGENYWVCQRDANGNKTSCGNVSDAGWAQFVQENHNLLTFTGGNSGNVLYQGNQIGTFQQTSVDATPGLVAVGTGTQMAAPIVKPLFAATMGFLGVLVPECWRDR